MSGRLTSLDQPARASGRADKPKAAVDLDAVAEARARSIAAAGTPACENTKGWWLIGERSGLAVPRTCKRWTCPACRRTKRLAALVALQHGLAVFADAGHEVHCLTLTDGRGDLDFASFYKRGTAACDRGSAGTVTRTRMRPRWSCNRSRAACIAMRS